ncbi:zinc finger family protein [Tripterygium wilfordii]|uniref:Zinc finger family protein n=1 Tax=Tripterygium wilfordii TaxID=458696 RepID=A0A7J7CZ26_TRIWF|nr:B-box zinc finger protein 32 [Tripterygium wilfordii]KAF5739219.1 zinc finger family protein [Tripterygium wilfordii]
MKARVCELCGHQATIYCASDSSSLCSTCDSNVHQANFLAARHLRRHICSLCDSLSGIPFSGPASPHLRNVCDSCSLRKEVESVPCSLSLSSSSACLSSTKSFAEKKCLDGAAAKIASSSIVTADSGDATNRPTRRGEKSKPRTAMEAKSEDIFVNWLRKLGLKLNGGQSVVSSASRAFELCLDRSPVMPLRWSLAASFWLGVRSCGDRSLATWQNLRRLEKVSGVPAKLIVAIGSRLVLDLRARSAGPRLDLEEGWAES